MWERTRRYGSPPASVWKTICGSTAFYWENKNHHKLEQHSSCCHFQWGYPDTNHTGCNTSINFYHTQRLWNHTRDWIIIQRPVLCPTQCKCGRIRMNPYILPLPLILHSSPSCIKLWWEELCRLDQRPRGRCLDSSIHTNTAILPSYPYARQYRHFNPIHRFLYCQGHFFSIHK